jgi:hypothetical protein
VISASEALRLSQAPYLRCANVRIRNGHVIGGCRRRVGYFCTYCKALRCPLHGKGRCDACGATTVQIERDAALEREANEEKRLD